METRSTLKTRIPEGRGDRVERERERGEGEEQGGKECIKRGQRENGDVSALKMHFSAIFVALRRVPLTGILR